MIEEINRMYKIALIRSASSAVSKSQYNIQEIGMAKRLAELGMEVDVFLISDKDETYHEDIPAENKVIVYWLKGLKIPGQQGYYHDLKAILDKNHYDLIQALDDSQITTVLVSLYCKKHHIKFVLWQGMYENYPETYKKIIQTVFDRTLLPILRRNSKYCITKTSSAKGYLLNKKFKNITSIPVGIEVSNFATSKEIDYRISLGIPKKNKIFLYVGKVEDRRKPLFLMDVFSLINKKHKDVTLIYVGQGPMLEETHKYVKDHNIENIVFIDKIPQNELSSLYKTSNLFILPTRYEIFGMVLLEAMYFGTPVITYTAAGPLDVIENKVDGLLIDNFDAHKWANIIEENIFENDKSHEMGIKAQKKIIAKYMWDITGEAYFNTYKNIIEN